MLQDIRANSALSDPETPHSRRSPEANQFSADTYADRLMNDLFQDVEQLLELEPPQSTGPLESTSSDPAELPLPVLEDMQELPQRAMPLAPRPEALVALQATDLVENQSLAELNAVAIAPEVATPPPPAQTQNRWLPFLFTAGCVSVALAVMGWWLYVDGKYRQQVAVAPNPETNSPGAANTQQFAEYLQKSLRNIEQQPSPTAGVALTPERNPAAPGLPTVVIPRSTLPAPGVNSAVPGSERVYVPVYQLPTNLYPPGTPVAPLPNLPQQTKPKPGAASKTATSSPAVARKLVGVLEQGNNSVALFEINGVTQRYELGESIGSSGWTLVEVSKNQAIVRRNGEVRSLFVGHSF